MTQELRTDSPVTWCPGCPNFIILESARKALLNLIKQGYKRENFAMTVGIGCHAKIFDYLDISGIYGLHGRTIPTAMGIKIGNPNLTVLAFAGDGDTYAEGIGHFVHAGRYNTDMTLMVHDNQTFSLTTGQGSPTSQENYKNKAEPLGKSTPPLNPIKLALSSEISFIARCNARDITHTQEVLEKAITHKGFSFIEIIQDCTSFNLDVNKRDKDMYQLNSPCKTKDQALKLADEFDYNIRKGKIPLGIFWQENKKTLTEEWPQLSNLKKKGIGWKDLKR
ncbi:MAG: 2-oxoacid:ferredoxin oxidoreductase subunit beta [Nanoarchaeota archaeon]|nr:2-oxoacid:ferredoxin oxidoreductase subunit beta [Nanoarchaeota archaeon]MBU1052144.1 2-oxoacid:ferredoxin oxidoreductase subunit beta [Nanoarchaeota archaeon]MBU1988579.1 2-oxoacid:ferredoxin oxidoreductase subunit beta [Nanoarchaeota archaeon]